MIDFPLTKKNYFAFFLFCVFCFELQGVDMEVSKGKIWYIVQFLYYKDENANHAAIIVKVVYSPDTETVNCVQLWFR